MSYGSTDIDSNEIRPIEAGQSEPPSRTGTPTLQNFSISSPSDTSVISTIHTPTPELRENPLYQLLFNKDKILISYKNTLEYNQFNRQTLPFGQQHHQIQHQVVPLQHHKEDQIYHLTHKVTHHDIN